MSSPREQKMGLHVVSRKFYVLTFRVLEFNSQGYYTYRPIMLTRKSKCNKLDNGEVPVRTRLTAGTIQTATLPTDN